MESNWQQPELSKGMNLHRYSKFIPVQIRVAKKPYFCIEHTVSHNKRHRYYLTKYKSRSREVKQQLTDVIFCQQSYNYEGVDAKRIFKKC